MILHRTKTSLLKRRYIVTPKDGEKEAQYAVVNILPGNNVIEDEQVLAFMEQDESLQELIELGVHRIIRAKVEVEDPAEAPKAPMTDDFSKMNQKSALLVIKETYAIPSLEGMLESETAGKKRSKVIAAIEAQIKEIKTIPGKDDK